MVKRCVRFLFLSALLNLVGGCQHGAGSGFTETATRPAPAPAEPNFHVIIPIPPSEIGKIHISPVPRELRYTGKSINLGVNDPTPRFDAYFTWSNYTGEDRSKAVYIWNGTAIGTGDDGMYRIWLKIAELPAGSTILAFPRTDPRDGGTERSAPYQWGNNSGILADLICFSGDTLYFSWRDQNDRVVRGWPFEDLVAEGRMPAVLRPPRTPATLPASRNAEK